jgi:3-deoxy-7-phosphoheptulonate synthase
MATAPELDTQRIVAALRASNLLANVPEEELADVAREFRLATAGPGELLLRQAGPSTGFGFVIDGQVAVRIDGREHTRLARGEAFGEISALLGAPVTGDVVALGPVSYVFLERERIEPFLIGHPHLCFGMLQGEANRLRDPTRWYSSQAARGAAGAPDWTPESWRSRPAGQQPDWPNRVALDIALDELRGLPPLVFGGEARMLRRELGAVAAGRAFLLQAGDCAESFAELTTSAVHDRLRVILQMAMVLTYGSGSHIVKLARMAGQFAKPRSAALEEVDGVELPVYRGDIVNGVEPDPARRVADPQRMLTAYGHSAAKLNLIRSLTTGGFGALDQVHAWNRDFVASSPIGRRYEALATEIERALRFVHASRLAPDMRTLSRADVWTSHEALLLPYEEALTRRDETTGEWYATSAHMLWIGERTRELDGAHVEFMAGIGNPIGCKLGPTATAADALALCERLNPARVPGRLTLITRMGAGQVAEKLPPLLAAVRDAGHPVVWVCDPMHANTVKTSTGRKTRRFDDVLAEVEAFFAACTSESVWPGGLHVELTGEDVTECLGGGEDLSEADLDRRYATMCDPRLNARQSLDLAFQVAGMLSVLTGRADRRG